MRLKGVEKRLQGASSFPFEGIAAVPTSKITQLPSKGKQQEGKPSAVRIGPGRTVVFNAYDVLHPRTSDGGSTRILPSSIDTLYFRSFRKRIQYYRDGTHGHGNRSEDGVEEAEGATSKNNIIINIPSWFNRRMVLERIAVTTERKSLFMG